MHHSRLVPSILVLAAGAAAPTLPAQSTNATGAYTALLVSPPGALPPTITNMLFARPPATEVDVRYGQWQDGSLTTRDFGATGRFGVSRGASLGATAGYVEPRCDGCEGSWMMGIVADQRVILASHGGTRVVSALTEDLGFAKQQSASGHAVSASVHCPASVVRHLGDYDLAWFVSPGYGYGRTTTGSRAYAGTRPMFGGGIGIAKPTSGFGLTISGEQIETQGARPVFGASVTLLGR